jgi:hypothetical protein
MSGAKSWCKILFFTKIQRTMKKFICLMLPFALFLLNPMDVSAQDQGKSKEKKEAQKGQSSSDDVLTAKGASGLVMGFHLEQLRADLSLADEQIARLQEISEAHEAKRLQVETRKYDTKAERKQAEENLWNAQMTKIKKVLNKEQQAKFEKMLEKRQQKIEEGRPNDGNGS